MKEIEEAVLVGRADVAVHSAKDLPSTTAEGLVLGAFPRRADPRDALVGARLWDLEPGSAVATGAARRRCQLAWLRPDLSFVGLRGNIGTRLGRVPPGGAVVVAMAALERLGQLGVVAEALDPLTVVPQVGQGSLALECREGDAWTLEALVPLDDTGTRHEVEAERSFAAALGAGCDVPVGALGRWDGSSVHLVAAVASRDGHVMVRSEAKGPSEEVGTALAKTMLERCGAGDLLGVTGLPLFEGSPS